MPKYKTLLGLFLILLIIILFYIGIKSHMDLKMFQAFLNKLGMAAPIVFIFIYAIGPVFFIPITPLSITSGILFGPFWGTIVSLLGANLGATTTFVISRYLLKDWIDQKSSERVNIMQKKVQEEGWKFVSVSRLIPVFPFNIQNYIFGITNIDLKTFFFASILGLIPGTFAYTYLGYLGKNAMFGDQNATFKIIIPVALIVFISLIPYVMAKFHKKVI